MNKKNLRFYEAPAFEVVELNASTALLAGSEKTNPFHDSSEEIKDED